MTRKQLKEKAKSDIKDRVLICFAPILVVYFIEIILNAITGYYSEGIASIVISLVSAPLNIGLAYVYLNIVTSRADINFKDIFIGYKKINQIVQYTISNIIKYLYIVLGTICFIVPGIILAIRYSFTDYIFAENRDLTYKEILNKSKSITEGYKSDIFFLYLSFVGWMLGSILTFGILYIYVGPYIKASMANLYLTVKNRQFVDENSALNDKNHYDNEKNHEDTEFTEKNNDSYNIENSENTENNKEDEL